MAATTAKYQKPAAFLFGAAVFLLLGLAEPAAAQYRIYDLDCIVKAQDIRADHTNTVHFIWVDQTVLYYGTIVNNAISGKVKVATGVETAMWRPYLSVEPYGASIHIAWTTGGFGNSLMHSWRINGVWKTEKVLTVRTTQKLSQATCAIDSRGILHVMYVIWNNVSTNDWATVFYTRKLASGTWEEKGWFVPYDVEYKHPQLLNDWRGNVHATWTLQGKYLDDIFEAYWCTAPAGDRLSYTDMVKIPKAEGSDVNGYGELYVDRYGVVHRSIGGWSKIEEKMCLDHVKKPVGALFDIPTRPSLGFLNLASDPMPVTIAAEDGRAVVAWGELGADGSNTVKASFYDPVRGTWTMQTIDPAAGIPKAAYSYRVALTRTETHIYGAWRAYDGHLKLFVMPIDGHIKKDFNQDGRVDILWRNTGTGENRVWYMNGAKKLGEKLLSSVVDKNWKIVGTGDFNGDGKVDILWRHYGIYGKGANRVWFMDGSRLIGSAYLPEEPGIDMKIAGTGDFNRDGKMDILWRDYRTGSNSVWYMDGVTLLGVGLLPATAKSLELAGTGDFNRDGKVDILWRNNSTGSNWVWYMDGIKQIGSGWLPAMTYPRFEVAGTGDFNGDEKVDILWRNYSTGSNWVWYMDNKKQIGQAWMPKETDLNWRIENR